LWLNLFITVFLVERECGRCGKGVWVKEVEWRWRWKGMRRGRMWEEGKISLEGVIARGCGKEEVWKWRVGWVEKDEKGGDTFRRGRGNVERENGM
jgi:hypothetical protein